ncbi:MAG: hypothetical protein Q6K90_02405 [Gloeomargarita sp. HHBFW_bins_162]
MTFDVSPELNHFLEQRLNHYRTAYGAYNQDPQAWEAQHGAWVVYEHREKALLLKEISAILDCLHRQTLYEGHLDTAGDLEYYSTVKEALQIIRQFLEQHPPQLS